MNAKRALRIQFAILAVFAAFALSVAPGCGARQILTDSERTEWMLKAEKEMAAYQNAQSALASAEEALHLKAPADESLVDRGSL